MKINGKFDSGSVDKLIKPQGGGRSTASAATEAAGSESAVAKFSGKASEVAQLGAPMDAAKIESIRQAIANGEFKVNAEAVADGVISDARALLGTQ
ncbi:flagellar biosynthesis anti-sigma factor FlgM [Limnobacter sp.]|uniref:flagellar biosynthesis anti-sigma factor FlgM n=1 Tax=Limnobacter sp. TaxID=2003368 RepID=UPI0035114ABE